MKINILYKQIKIKHNMLLLIKLYPVENIKSVLRMHWVEWIYR